MSAAAEGDVGFAYNHGDVAPVASGVDSIARCQVLVMLDTAGAGGGGRRGSSPVTRPGLRGGHGSRISVVGTGPAAPLPVLERPTQAGGSSPEIRCGRPFTMLPNTAAAGDGRRWGIVI